MDKATSHAGTSVTEDRIGMTMGEVGGINEKIRTVSISGSLEAISEKKYPGSIKQNGDHSGAHRVLLAGNQGAHGRVQTR